jgi:hypothetical protein
MGLDHINRTIDKLASAYFMARTPGAFTSNQEEIELHLAAKAEQLELLL